MRTKAAQICLFEKMAASLAALLAAVFLLCAPAQAKDPHKMKDSTWINISGTIKNVQADAFTLAYAGDGTITVEMDDGDRDSDGYLLSEGDKVVVTGKIDKDFFQKATIEAAGVYVEKLATTFFASSVDEEEQMLPLPSPSVVLSSVELQGTVTETQDGAFWLNSGILRVRVDVSALKDDPLDSEGYLKVEKGDVVRVFGVVDKGLFEGREILASALIEIRD